MATQPKRSAGDVASQLRKQIVAAIYVENERLPSERSLAEQFNVARGTLREALHLLESMGLVVRRAGSGTYVTYSEGNQSLPILQSTSPLELMDARFALEPHMCRLAVLNGTERGLARLEQSLIAVEQAGMNTEEFGDRDENFHLSLAECTQNYLLIWMSKRVSEVRSQHQWSRMRELTLDADMIATYNRHHRQIFAAISARNGELAASAMKSHLVAARNSLIEAASS